MNKLEKDLYITHAKRLNVILEENSTFIPYLARKDFQQTLQNELNILRACEKIFSKEKTPKALTSKALKDRFNQITKSEFELDEKFKYDDEADLIDGIHYLVTFCNNMFKVNLDDLISGKKVTATDPKIDLKAKQDFDGDGSQKINPNLAFAAAGMPVSATPYENPFLLGKAYAKINDDMKQGKFCKFKTQPKIIPIVKLISTILLILLALSFIASSVFAFMADGLLLDVGGDEPAKLGGVFCGVFYIIVAGFCIYPTVTLIMSMAGKWGKNPNLKFYFPWGTVLMSVILAFMIMMFDINKTVLLENHATIIDRTGIKYTAWYAWKIMFIVCCGLVAVNIIPLVLGAVYNPKTDVEKLEQKVKEYIDMFAAESVSNSVPPSVDVQKPAEVKEKSKAKDKTKPTSDSNKK